jgi:hypothetical protein
MPGGICRDRVWTVAKRCNEEPAPDARREGRAVFIQGEARVIDDSQHDSAQHDSARREKSTLIDASVPNAARVADYLSGRRNNFEADRKMARAMLATDPSIAAIMPAARAFHHRAVRFLAAEAGVRQFLEIGAGLPGTGSSHEIAQSVDPACRVVCVASDPMVLSHWRALWRDTPQSPVAALDINLSDPAAILAAAATTLDFRRPVAVLVPSTLAFIPSAASASAIVTALMTAAASGSYLALYQLASDLDPALLTAASQWNRVADQQIALRSRAEMADLTAGLALIEPGLVPVNEWRPPPTGPGSGPAVPVYGVVARKP